MENPISWIEEKIPYLPNGNWLYKVVCFVLFKRKKKLSYKEYMMLLYEINRKKIGEDLAKEKAIIKALDIYKGLHEGKLPEGV